MTVPLAVTYAEGTHRVAAPWETIARIAPHLGAMGITRLADITGLDRIGIPTWCSIRPRGVLLQVSNGKGTSHDSAKVSALMEAIELWHAENPAIAFRRASTEELRREAAAFLSVEALPDWRAEVHLTERRVIDWVRGEALLDGTPVWLPACAAFLCEPLLTYLSTNGLASGNHPVEATLHGLYEVIERDAVTRLSRGGLSLPRGHSRVVDLETLPTGPLGTLCEQLRGAGITLTLIRAETVAPVNTFWAVIVDPASPFACSYVNMGHGSHLDPTVAATRAITEAAQTRLTFIHGAREDLSSESYKFGEAHERLRAFFERQRGELPWSAISDHSSGDLARDLDCVLAGLRDAGYTRIYRIDLTSPRFAIPVVKVVVPGLQLMEGFMAP
ncbi:MAG: YcaO-like family protein [Alphaproteobacteria bacterium]